MDNMLELIAANLEDPICLTDLTGVVTYVSPGIEKLLRMPVIAVQGKYFADFVDVAQRTELELLYSDIITQGNSVRGLDVAINDALGNTLTVEVNGSALIENNQVVGTISIMRDVTLARKKERTAAFLAQSCFTGDLQDFFHTLARFLGTELPADYVCIDILAGDAKSAKTLAIYYDGKFEDNVEYTLADTPCGVVAQRSFCCYPAGVRHQFPRDLVLQEMCAESYLGVVLYNTQKEAIGLIATISRKPLEHPESAAGIIKMVSTRAAGELERLIALEAMRESQEKLGALLIEKDLILKEVHHRIKNNLTTVIGLLSLHADAVSNIEAVAALEDAIGRVRSMLRLYDRLYLAGEFQSASVRAYLGPLAEEIVSTFPRAKDVVLQLEIEDFSLDIRRLLPLGIIINELLTNTMKHAFALQKQGNILLKIAKAQDEVEVLLQDDGIGLPDECQHFRPDSFGLQLVAMLAEQMDGRIHRQNEGGAVFSLKFNLH